MKPDEPEVTMMKKTLIAVLIFALILAALLGISALAERLRPAEETDIEEPAPTERVITNPMTPDNATVIELRENTASVRGVGAEYAGGVLTIGYPGTYRLSGTLDTGVVVDTGDFHGGVYLILDGVSITNDDGPALHVKQADLTVLYLSVGAENQLRDGSGYTVQEGTEVKTGAGIYCADDLRIEGEGSLTVVGEAADGIRSKDGLRIEGGSVTVFCADDGLQASDYAEILGGKVTVYSTGDGVNVRDGYFALEAGTVNITSVGDGVSALTEADITGGTLNIRAGGGSENYAEIALEDRSAKGVKADNVTITGGVLGFDTADDAIHARKAASLSGDAEVTILSGDDAVRTAPQPCIRCAKCVGACPMGLEPYLLAKVSEVKNWEKAEQEDITSCIECGSCQFTCPAHRPLLDYIRQGKSTVMGLIRSRAAKK